MSQSVKSDARALDIGCGTNKIPGAIGMDVNPRSAADVIHAGYEESLSFAMSRENRNHDSENNVTPGGRNVSRPGIGRTF